MDNIKLKLKRIIIYSILILIILFLSAPIQFASLTANDLGLISVHIINTFNDEDLEGINIKVYSIKEVSNSDTLESEYTADFASFNQANEEDDDYIDKLSNYIESNNISCINKTSNAKGMVYFNDLKLGLYLILSDAFKIGGKDYQITPFIINLPTDDNGELQLNIKATPKIFEVKEPDIIPSEEPEENVITDVSENKNERIGFLPKTGDGIVFDIILLFISIIILVILHFTKIKKNKE